MPEAEPIPFARPFIGAEEETAVLKVLRSGWLTTGSEALALEKDFAEFLCAPPSSRLCASAPLRESPSPCLSASASLREPPPSPRLCASAPLREPPSPRLCASAPLREEKQIHCLAVNSATSGLHLALEACGIQNGDSVLLPSLTFTSTAEVARYLGADPVFVDVAPGSFHIDPKALEAKINALKKNGKTPKAVMPVHYGGLACDMKAIMDIAKRYNLRVIEDAAHSFPSRLSDGSYAGSIGDAGVFSFYATKTLTTGEGGMVVCRDEAIARRVSVMRSHGIDRSVWNRYTDTKASWYYQVTEAGYKYNLPDLLAAVGRVQLARAWELLAMRQKIAAAYDSAFGSDERFCIPPSGDGDARHLYPLRLNPACVKVSRDEVIQKLQERFIGVSVHFIPLHTMPFYKNRYGLNDEDFPETMKSFNQEISLPIWPGMSETQVERVIEAVKSITKEQ